MGVIPHAGQTHESELHARFDQYALDGEWFEDTPELRSFVEEVSDGAVTDEMRRASGRSDPQTQAWLAKTLAPSLRYLRAGKGWTQQELAEQSGISRQYISSLERGNTDPTATTLLRLANAYGVTVAELLRHNR